MEDPAKASDDEDVLPTRMSDDEGCDKSEEEKSEPMEAEIQSNDEDNEDGKRNDVIEEEEDDTTVFVSKVAFKAVKDKLAKSKAPTKAELMRLADFDAVPDGEAVICIDISVLGSAFAVPGDRVKAVDALIKEKTLKGAAELFIKAEEAAGLELGEDDDEEEESEEEEQEEKDEVVMPSPKRAVASKAAAAKASPKRAVASKAGAAKAPKASPVKVPPMKAATAKPPAAKRAKTM